MWSFFKEVLSGRKIDNSVVQLQTQLQRRHLLATHQRSEQAPRSSPKHPHRL